jgi:hypothetical protein
MSEDSVPDEYTESRQQFGRRAITTSEAAKALFVDLLGGYTRLNNFVDPIKGPPKQGSGTGTGTGTGTGATTESERIEGGKPLERFDGHNPYLVHDIIKAIDALIEFTAEKYL